MPLIGTAAVPATHAIGWEPPLYAGLSLVLNTHALESPLTSMLIVHAQDLSKAGAGFGSRIACADW